MINSETIKKNFNLFITRITNPAAGSFAENNEDLPDMNNAAENQEQPSERITTDPVVVTVLPSPGQTETGTQTVMQERPAEQTTTPDSQTPTQTQTQTPQVQSRERVIYFTQVDRDGQILHSRVARTVPVSETPMQDALNIMLAGPSADEINRGIINLVPQNTRILSAIVRGSTAYISFSEDFLFNTFGVEGYVAQLRQIVWTVTEFPNVSDVQILIEGRRLDYLGEGIWIGSPISRESFN